MKLFLSRIVVTTLSVAVLLAAPLFAQQRDYEDVEYRSDRGEQREDDDQRSRDRDYRDQDERRDRDETRNRRDNERDAETERREREYNRNQRDDAEDLENRESRTNRNRQNEDEPAGLGVVVVDNGRQGIIVNRVFRNSPADQAGVRTGDEILEVDGRRVSSTQRFVSMIRDKSPDSSVEFRIRRNGSDRTLTAQLESRREALNIQESRQRQYDRQRWNDTPHGHDDLIEHIGDLERHIRRLSDEIADLRKMVSSTPDFEHTRSRTDNQRNREQRQSR